MQRDYNGWEYVFLPEFSKPYFVELKEFLVGEYATKSISPKAKDIFRAFDMVEPREIKVVILGQDPYPTPGHAMGLSFSVPKGIMPLPPTLRNIFDEIEAEYGRPSKLPDGDLTPWAKQGVLLLNTVMTVVTGKTNSHRNHGWEPFTDAVIRAIDALDQPIVFLLWGNNAAAKKILLKNPKHLVLITSHPSPLSSYQGFDGCGHFVKANEYLEKYDRAPINW